MYLLILLLPMFLTECPEGFTDISNDKSRNSPNGDCIKVLSKGRVFH